MAELDNQERKLKGVSAASTAFSAISELFRAPTPERVSVQSTKDEESVSSFKDHQVRPLDRVIGPNGLLRGFRILVVLTGLIFVVFLKINSMISEIPVVVEKRAVVKVSEALGVQPNAAQAGAVLVSPSKAESPQNAHAGVDADIVKSVVSAGSDDGANALKNEVERLRQQVEKYKGLYEAATRGGTNTVETIEVPVDETTENVGVVREEEVRAPRMLREVGAVGIPSERI